MVGNATTLRVPRLHASIDKATYGNRADVSWLREPECLQVDIVDLGTDRVSVSHSIITAVTFETKDMAVLCGRKHSIFQQDTQAIDMTSGMAKAGYVLALPVELGDETDPVSEKDQ